MSVTCPCCGKDMEIREIPYEVPYFGEIVIITIRCSSCGYRFTDVIIPHEHGRKKYRIKISRETLNKRVIKSSTAYIRIPELEIEVIPGGISQGIVTNVEGILYRIEEVLEMAANFYREDEEKRKKCLELIEKVRKLRNGEMEATLEIEDPTGNSAIVEE